MLKEQRAINLDKQPGGYRPRPGEKSVTEGYQPRPSKSRIIQPPPPSRKKRILGSGVLAGMDVPTKERLLRGYEERPGLYEDDVVCIWRQDEQRPYAEERRNMYRRNGQHAVSMGWRTYLRVKGELFTPGLEA